MDTNKQNLQDYLNQEFSCDCGKSHSVPIHLIDIGAGALQNVPRHIKAGDFHKVFVVCDSNTYQIAAKELSQRLTEAGIFHKVYQVPHTTEELVPDEKAVGSIMMALEDDYDLFVAVGSGTLNDLTRYISSNLGVPFMIVGTAPSMDGFASTVCALSYQNLKITRYGNVPYAIIGDTDILKNAPQRLLQSGCGDIIGKYICLADWKNSHILNDEYYCPSIVTLVEQAVQEVVDNIDGIYAREPQSIENLMKALVLSGLAMSFVGNSRPASGCEHHLSHFWETKLLMEGKTHKLHGIQVGVGSVVTAYLYHQLLHEPIDWARAENHLATYSPQQWEESMRTYYGSSVGPVLELEEQAQTNSPQQTRQRLDSAKEHWAEILTVIRDEVPTEEEVIRLLTVVGAPTNPGDILVNREMLADSVVAAKELRDRHTLLQLLWDLGYLEEYAQRAADHFYGKQ